MPSRHEYTIVLQSFQSARLRRDHAPLAKEPQYQLLGQFFFEELYGARDFRARDEQAQRLHQFISLAPGLTAHDIDQVLQLLDLTRQLDDSVVEQLIRLDSPLDFDEATYEYAYRLADNYDERMLQLNLVRSALYNVHRLGRRPLLGIALQSSQRLAKTVGMGELHRFLRIGYRAIQQVRDMRRFVETIYQFEYARLNRIYGKG